MQLLSERQLTCVMPAMASSSSHLALPAARHRPVAVALGAAGTEKSRRRRRQLPVGLAGLAVPAVVTLTVVLGRKLFRKRRRTVTPAVRHGGPLLLGAP